MAKHPIWNRIFFALEVACIPVVIWWVPYSHLPAPGWAVALIAGAAAAMSVHDDMKGWQKGLWMLIIGAFLITELRAINKDRIFSQAQALQDREDQDAAFKMVRDAQNAGFTATAEGLTAAIGGIKSTLTTANTTLRQTQPHAALHLDKIELSPNATELKSETPYKWNYYFVNSGSATATDVVEMQKIYVANADDKDAQLGLAERFNKEWKTGKQKTDVVIVPNVPHFNTLTRTFSNDEMRDFAPKRTIYFLFRFEYTDETGRWRMDDCEALQRNSSTEINAVVSHVCEVFVNARYPVKLR